MASIETDELGATQFFDDLKNGGVEERISIARQKDRGSICIEIDCRHVGTKAHTDFLKWLKAQRLQSQESALTEGAKCSMLIFPGP